MSKGSGTKMAIVREVEMPLDAKNAAITLIEEVMKHCTSDRYITIAMAVKKKFDEKFGANWHCIVGNEYGSFLTPRKNHFVYIEFDKLLILLFKAKTHARFVQHLNKPTQIAAQKSTELPNTPITFDGVTRVPASPMIQGTEKTAPKVARTAVPAAAAASGSSQVGPLELSPKSKEAKKKLCPVIIAPQLPDKKVCADIEDDLDKACDNVTPPTKEEEAARPPFPELGKQSAGPASIPAFVTPPSNSAELRSLLEIEPTPPATPRQSVSKEARPAVKPPADMTSEPPPSVPPTAVDVTGKKPKPSDISTSSSSSSSSTVIPKPGQAPTKQAAKGSPSPSESAKDSLRSLKFEEVQNDDDSTRQQKKAGTKLEETQDSVLLKLKKKEGGKSGSKKKKKSKKEPTAEEVATKQKRRDDRKNETPEQKTARKKAKKERREKRAMAKAEKKMAKQARKRARRAKAAVGDKDGDGTGTLAKEEPPITKSFNVDEKSFDEEKKKPEAKKLRDTPTPTSKPEPDKKADANTKPEPNAKPNDEKKS